MIGPHRIMVLTRTRTWVEGSKVRCRNHYTTTYDVHKHLNDNLHRANDSNSINRMIHTIHTAEAKINESHKPHDSSKSVWLVREYLNNYYFKSLWFIHIILDYLHRFGWLFSINAEQEFPALVRLVSAWNDDVVPRFNFVMNCYLP